MPGPGGAPKPSTTIPYVPGAVVPAPKFGAYIPEKPKPKPRPYVPSGIDMADADRANTTAANRARADTLAALGSGYAPDPFGGMTFLDVLQGMQTPYGSPSSSRGSGRGGGGGGGGAAVAEVDPAVQAAYKALYEQMGLDQSGQFNDAEARLRAAQGGAQSRLAGIEQDLLSRLAETRSGVANAYRSGGRALGALNEDYTSQADQTLVGGRAALDAFGAGDLASTNRGNVSELLTALQGLQTSQGANAAAQYASRPQMYGSLRADAATATGQQFDALLAKLNADRIAAQTAQRQQQLQLALQAAQQGVTL